MGQWELLYFDSGHGLFATDLQVSSSMILGEGKSNIILTIGRDEDVEWVPQVTGLV